MIINRTQITDGLPATLEVADVPVTSKAVHKATLMKEDFIKLSFESDVDYKFKAGDFISYEGMAYYLPDDVFPTMKDEATFSYELQFNAPWYNLDKVMFLFNTYHNGTILKRESDWYITDTAQNILALIIRSTNDPDRDCQCRFNSILDCEPTVSKTFTFSSTSILAALNTIAKDFELEWWVTYEEGDFFLHFGECDNSVIRDGNGAVVFSDGARAKNAMLRTELTAGRNVTKPSVSQKQGLKRLYYVFGSSRNVDQTISSDDIQSGMLTSIVTKRLELAGNPQDMLEGSGEEVVIFDDIYQRSDYMVTGVTPIEIISEEVAGYDQQGDPVYKRYNVYNLKIQAFSDYVFGLIDTDQNVQNIEDIVASGKQLSLKFITKDYNGQTVTPKLAGFEFEVGATLCSDSNTGDQWYEFQIIKQEVNGYIIPNDNLIPEVGDWVCIYNVKSAYIDGNASVNAQTELRDAFNKWYANKKKDISYTVKPYANENVDLNLGYAVSLTYRGNTVVSRVFSFEKHLDYSIDASYTISSYAKFGSVNQLKEDVKILTASIANGTAGGALDASALSNAVTVYGRRLFLSKTNEDTANGHITFQDGLTSQENASLAKGTTIGTFTSGLLGQGACIDSHGDAEVNSLYSREFISTPEFRFNKVSVTEGEQWNTNGFGTIIDVDYENQIIELKLEEGEYASIQEGDICRGIYNLIGYNEENPENQKSYNTEAQAEDENKFPTKAGFFTSYFYVKKILTPYQAGVCRFTYETKSQQINETDTTPHPCKNMKFAQYGSFTNRNRQSSMYMTSIHHNYIQLLEGVKTWDIKSPNIVSRYGYLGNLTITLRDSNGNTYDRTLEGNGLYVQDNVYFGNAVIQLDPVTLADLADQLASYQVYLSSYTDVIKVDDAGNVIDGLWYVETIDGEPVNRYRISTVLTVRKGANLLTLAPTGQEVGRGTYKVACIPHGCMCQFDGSTLYITHIDNVKDGIAGSSDDTDFDYDACREMERVWVDLVVDCEGVGTIVQVVPITIKHDPVPYIMADLTNENAGISWSTQDNAYVGLPISTEINMAKGNEDLAITAIAVSSINGAAPDYVARIWFDEDGIRRKTQDGWEFLFDTTAGVFRVLAAPYDLPAVSEILITCSTTYAGVSYERTLSLHIMRSEDMAIYDLITRPTTVNVDKNDVINYEDVSLEVYRTTTASGREKVTSLPTGFTLKYKVTRNTSSGTVVGAETAMTYSEGGAEFAVDDPSWVNDITAVEFTLYNDSNNIEDCEGVPIVREGKGGQGSVGPAGKGIYTITDYYLNTKRSSNVTKNTTLDSENDNGQWGTSFIAPTETYPYTWRYTHYRYTDDTTSDTGLNCELIATYSEDGRGVTGITVWYLKTSVETGVTRPANPAGAGWANSYVAPDSNQKYIWRFYDFAYSDGTHVYSECELISVYTKDGMGTQDAYTVVDEGVTPSITDATGDLPVSASPVVWQLGTDGLAVGTGECLWMSERTYDGAVYSNWGSPVRISGDKGEQGRDGKGIEFIFKQSATTTVVQPANDHKDQDGYVPDGWQPSPLGVDNTAAHKYELMCQRIKATGSALWGDWSTAVVWSAYGDKGTDGDGVEYVFKRTTNATAPSRPSSSAGYVNSDGEFVPLGWSDNPQGVGWSDEEEVLYLCEWVSVRKKLNGSWTVFSTPALWATYSEAPTVEIKGTPPTWWINNVNTGVVAEGADGTGIKLKGSKEVMYTTAGKTALEDVSNAEVGDCWVVDSNRHLYVYVGGDTFPNNWQDMGEFRGQKGDDGSSSYVHFAWADEILFDEDGVTLQSCSGFSLVKGEEEYKWMGICTDNSESDPDETRWTEYKWNNIKGKDGASYERVYIRTAIETMPTVSYTTDTNGRTRLDDEYLPAVGNKNTCQAAAARFTDDPQGVGENYPFEWTAERKKTNDTWGDFSTPSLWAKYAADGQGVFKAFVFCRKETKPDNPTGGSYAKPVPTGGEWSTAIPTGTLPLWMSSCVFTSDGAPPQQQGTVTWGTPILMSDTDVFDVEFSDNAVDNRPEAPNGTNQGGSGKVWHDPVANATYFLSHEMNWMATRQKEVSALGIPEWGDWTIVCIKGTKGDGITSITTYYLKTTLYTGVSAPSSPLASGWTTSYEAPDEDRPYVWRFTRTVIENQAPSDTSCELIAVYTTSPNINLLDDTAFSSDDAMEAWTVKGLVGGDDHADPNNASYNAGGEGYGNYFRIDGGTQAHNSYHAHFRGAETGWINLLVQPLYVQGSVEKIEPATWYTLSFWLKGSKQTDYSSSVAFRIYVSMTNLATTASGEYMYVDGQRVTSSQNVRLFVPTAEWERHIITFKTPPTLTNDTILKWDMFDTSYTQDVYICMPKLEVGMVATTYTDSAASNKVVPRSSDWQAGQIYYAGNAGERFLDIVKYNGLWYRCKKTHFSYDGSTIDATDTRPESDGGRLLWMSGGEYKFIATDVFFAREAAVDNLVATLLRTGAVGAPHVEMEGNEVAFYGTSSHPSIRLCVDSNGVGILRFYDQNGNALYDLGPNGITQSIDAEDSHYNNTLRKKIGSSKWDMRLYVDVDTNNGIVNPLPSSAYTRYYKLVEGWKKVGGVQTYNISNSSTPSTWDGREFISQPSDTVLRSSSAYSYDQYIPDGWYTVPMAFGTDGDYKYIEAHNFSQGQDIATINIYFLPSEILSNLKAPCYAKENGSYTSYTGVMELIEAQATQI